MMSWKEKQTSPKMKKITGVVEDAGVVELCGRM